MLIAASILGGLVLLVVGADMLVRGASQLAFAIGISPLIVGLTVVAFGTSAPELAVSVEAAFEGRAGVGLGNIFGSNICNTLLILGASALVAPLLVSRQLVRVDVPFMILVSGIVIVMGLDGTFSRLDGALLLVILAIYMAIQARIGHAAADALRELREAEDDDEDPIQAAKAHWVKALLRCVGGLVMLVGGAHFLVEGAVELAIMLGVSEVVIGLTIVAIGTSLPELMTSVVASLRGHRDIAVGNIVGSNLFNLLAVLGVASSVAPAAIEIQQSLIYTDMPLVLLTAVVCLPIFITGEVISRREGLLLTLGYVAYLGYQIYYSLESTA